jgi:uncharacterized protein (TIGR02145 family)
MKKESIPVISVITLFLVLIITGCNKDEVTNPVKSAIEIIITTIDVTQTTISVNGSIKNNNGEEILSKGVCWYTESMPTIDHNITIDGTGNGEFVSNLNKLSPEKSYYVRGYATTKSGIYYSAQTVIKTSPFQFAVVKTGSVKEITPFTAIVEGTVISDGDDVLLARGISVSTDPNCRYTTSGNSAKNITSGNSVGNYEIKLTELTKNTTYYVRAHAINYAGWSYGDIVTFKTEPLVLPPAVRTNFATGITLSSAIVIGLITNTGDGEILEKGACWSTSKTPTLNDEKAVDEGEVENQLITGYITGLESNKTYYARSYCINSAGTAYGDVVSFTTGMKTNETVTDIDGNIYHIIKIGSQVWMVENLKTTRYRDGSPIPNISNNDEWVKLKTGACCDYENKSSNSNTYGKLYNWYAAADSRNIAPAGWRVPTSEDYDLLASYLGGWKVAGGKLKEAGTAHWSSPNISGTNETGFTGLPAGRRDSSYSFEDLYYTGYFWTSSPPDNGSARCWMIMQRRADFGKSSGYLENGYSIRCIRENQ